MSRWSKDEDDYILKFIQEVEDDINYSELVASHNKSFITKRTEDEEKRNKLLSEYSELYNKFMSEAYIYIRCSI